MLDEVNMLAPRMINLPIPTKFTGFRLSQTSTVAVGQIFLLGIVRFHSGRECLLFWAGNSLIKTEEVDWARSDSVIDKVQDALLETIGMIRERLLTPVSKGFLPQQKNPIWFKPGEGQRMKGRPIKEIEWFPYSEGGRFIGMPEYQEHRRTKLYWKSLRGED